MNVSCILTTVQPSIECSVSCGSLNFLTALLCFQILGGGAHAQMGASFRQSGGAGTELFLGRVDGWGGCMIFVPVCL